MEAQPPQTGLPGLSGAAWSPPAVLDAPIPPPPPRAESHPVRHQPLLPETVLERNRAAVLARIERACHASHRNPADVSLLAVTKSVSIPHALGLARLGQNALAENRVAGLEQKAAALAEAGVPVAWHFVGHLQRNKARRVVRLADTLHSVDGLRLLETLERVAAEEGRRPGIYLELHIGGEVEKHGFALEAGPGGAPSGELSEALALLGEAEHLEPLGLMAMAPRRRQDGGDDARAAAAFARAADLARVLTSLPRSCFGAEGPRLSLGMSADLEQAVAAGSHCVRVGRALFAGLPAAGAREAEA